jgi:hypothetical protein
MAACTSTAGTGLATAPAPGACRGRATHRPHARAEPRRRRQLLRAQQVALAVQVRRRQLLLRRDAQRGVRHQRRLHRGAQLGGQRHRAVAVHLVCARAHLVEAERGGGGGGVAGWAGEDVRRSAARPQGALMRAGASAPPAHLVERAREVERAPIARLHDDGVHAVVAVHKLHDRARRVARGAVVVRWGGVGQGRMQRGGVKAGRGEMG